MTKKLRLEVFLLHLALTARGYMSYHVRQYGIGVSAPNNLS
ncbi:MAG: hypothetical protein ACK5O7_07025 [Holosporales bacterium]